MNVEDDFSLIQGGDCFSHWHSSDRVPTQDFRNGLDGVAKRITVASNYTALPKDDFIEVSAVATVTLPLARNGKVYTITRTGVGLVTVAVTGTDTIRGATTYALNTQWASATFKAIPGGWLIIATAT